MGSFLPPGTRRDHCVSSQRLTRAGRFLSQPLPFPNPPLAAAAPLGEAREPGRKGSCPGLGWDIFLPATVTAIRPPRPKRIRWHQPGIPGICSLFWSHRMPRQPWGWRSSSRARLCHQQPHPWAAQTHTGTREPEHLSLPGPSPGLGLFSRCRDGDTVVAGLILPSVVAAVTTRGQGKATGCHCTAGTSCAPRSSGTWQQGREDLCHWHLGGSEPPSRVGIAAGNC